MSDQPIPPGSPEWQARLELHLTALRRQITQHGYTVQSVLPTKADDGFEFSYTAGFTAAGLPELLIASLPTLALEQMLDLAAQRHREQPLQPGTVWECPATDYTQPIPMLARALPAGHPSLGMAYRLYGREVVTGLQLLWSNPPGVFPGEEGHQAEGLSQQLRA